MEINELRDLELRPGQLTVWRVNVPAPARWRSDPRRPSHVQEEHLSYLRDGGPAWLGIAFERPGDFDSTALTSAILGWVDRHEALRCRFAKDGPAIHLATIGPGAVALDRIELGDYTDAGELARTLEELLDAETKALCWPPYVFATISRPGSTSVVLASDHSVTDLYSLARVPHEISELYTAVVQEVAPQLAPAHSYLDYAEAERVRLTDLTAVHPAIGHWRDLVAANAGRLPDFPVPLGSPNGAMQRSGRIWLFDAATACEFGRACRAEGGNTVAGLFACLALVGKALANQQEFRTVTPFHTRNDPRWMDSFGWYVGMSPVSFPVSDTLPELLRAARLELERAKETARVPFSKAMELVGAALRDRFMVSYMDHRKVLGSHCWSRWRTRFLISRSADPHEAYLWINRSHEGICLSFRHPGTATARTAVDGYVAEVAALAHRISGALPRLRERV
ncbi:condensation domain-containing protein [Bradyrhizobium sp. Ai1a-2]|uniref:condensation domain-containing protein n=1 Tax=Bradyrhizobium sp. Ai1a-2 TaxID=196490 RepID=UPI000488B469|nr:condensation domain-containing protein [Bradyrhizobium sp. Ai1a-2]